VNFDPKIYAEIREKAGLSDSSPLVGEAGGGRAASAAQKTSGAEDYSAADAAGPHPNPPHEGEGELPDELRVFDYIYGVLHSPDYRRTYAQFLKIDFPRIPYPASPEVFAHIAEKGGQLRRLHLMEDAAIGTTPYPFKGDGDNVVVKPGYAQGPFASSPSTARRAGAQDKLQPKAEVEMPRSGALPLGVSTTLDTNGLGGVGRVLINPDQYFENVPAVAWEFHIGGYQPAQKWLKDRKGRALSFDDVMHYQKIIKILAETDRIMKEITLPL
jgi:Type ISP C-terminal specificity domain